MTRMRSLIGTGLFVAFCCAFLLFGFINQSKILSANKCKMTYSQPQFEKIKMDSRVKDYQLYVHGSASMLNPIPVLFIPGNSGSAKQVRSFASSMHNEDEKFQYFALHFNKDMSATHGSVAVKQAVFLNNALAAILSLYDSQGDVPVEVMLLAHSAGGLVARTALLLSNHPHQSVSSLIMLGSPVAKPTYTPDVSLDILNKKVNLAWRRSMYNATGACQTATLVARSLSRGDIPLAHATQMEDSVESFETTDNSAPVYASWDCSVNVMRTRVVSISGGEIDMEVPTPLTSLASLAPRPQNASMEAPEPKKLSSFLKPKGGYMRWFFFTIMALPRYASGFAQFLYETVMGSPVTVDTNNTSINDGNETSPLSNMSEPYVFRRMEDIPQDHWDAHIVPYQEPQHVSVRTSQLAGVGFPVDHKALLWCHQVVQTTTRIMTRLAHIPTDVTLTGAEMNSKIVKLKSKYALPTWTSVPDTTASSTCSAGDSSVAGSCTATDISIVPIAPVQEELLRNASKHFFSRTALDEERKYFLDLLTDTRPDAASTRGVLGNLIGGLSVTSLAVVTAHLSSVLTCYISISLLVMATFVLYFISVKNKWSVTTISHLYSSQSLGAEIALLFPENHLFLCSFADINAAIMPSFLSSHFIGSNGKDSKGISTAAIVIVLGVLIAHVVHSTQNPVDFVRFNGLYVQWIVSYGAALALQFSVLIAVHVLRYIVNRLCSISKLVWRSTVWCKPVRQFVRPRMRPATHKIHKLYSLVPAIEWVLLVFLLSALIVGMVMFGQQTAKLADSSGHTVGVLVQLSALLFLLSYTTFVIVLITAVVWPQAGSSRLLTPTIALCLPGVILGMATNKFCAEIFALSVESRITMSAASALLDTFGPDLINYALTCFFMTLNLLYLQRYESKILPVAFVYEIFDAAKRVRMGLNGSSGSNSFFSMVAGGGSNACLHEDGGDAAIFEENDKNVTSFGKGKVLLGPALRVVSCDCSLNKNLKSFGEWCEWCRCDSCGGKVISRSARTRAGAGSADSDSSYFDTVARTALGMRDITSDLLVFVVLVVSAGYSLMNAGSEPFRLFLVMGGVSAVMCVARICRYGGY